VAGASITAAATGRRWTIGVSKAPRYTRPQAKPRGKMRVPVTVCCGTDDDRRGLGISNPPLCATRRNRPGARPTLSVKWLLNEPRLLYPTANAISVTFIRVFSSMRFAW